MIDSIVSPLNEEIIESEFVKIMYSCPEYNQNNIEIQNRIE